MAIDTSSLSARIRARLEDEREKQTTVNDFRVVSETTSNPLQSSISKVIGNSASKSGTGLVKSLIKGIPSAIGGAVSNYIKQEQEFKQTHSLGEQAVRDLIEKPAQIGKAIGIDLPRMVLGGLSSVGKSALEAVYTPVFGKEQTREQLKGDPKLEKLLFAGETKSWQQVKEDVDAYTAESPVATDWEKQNLGITLAVAGFVGDIWVGGSGKSKLAETAIKELIETSDTAVIKSVLTKSKLPAALINDAAGSIATATTREEVEAALKTSAQKLLKQADNVAPKVADDAVGAAADSKYTRTINLKNPDDLAEVERMFNKETADNFAKGDFSYGRYKNDKAKMEEFMNAKIVDDTYTKPKVETAPYSGERTFFHGTSPESAAGIKTQGFKRGSDLPDGSFRGGGYGEVQRSVSFSTDPQMAGRFTGTGSKGELVRADLKQDAKVVTAKGIEDANELDAYIDDFLADGVDAVWIGGGEKELVVLNPDAIKYRDSVGFNVSDSKQTIASFASNQKGAPLSNPARKLTAAEKKAVKSVDESTSFNAASEKPTKLTPEKITTFNNLRTKVAGVKDVLIEQVQDEMVRMRRIVNDKNIKVSDETNWYDREIAFHGRVGTRLEDAKDTVREIDADVVKVAKANGIESEQLTKEVNEYLIARHAPERNAALGDGAAGITTADAQKVLAKYGDGAADNILAKEAQKYSSVEEFVAKADRDLVNKSFFGAKTGDVIEVNPNKLVVDADADLQQAVRKAPARKGEDFSKAPPIKVLITDKGDGVKWYIEDGHNRYVRAINDGVNLKAEITVGDFPISKSYMADFYKKVKSVAKAQQVPYAKEVKRIAEKIQTMNNQTLDILKEGEVITDELFDTLRSKYKNHIPLYRVMENEDDFAGALGKGFDVKGSGIKTAKGSKLEVADVLGNVAFNYEQAVIRAEKNRVDLSLLKLIRDNPEQLKDLFKVRRPKVLGKSWSGKPITEQITDPQILALREAGKPVLIEIRDPQLALAIRGVGRQKMHGMMRGVAAVSRMYSGIHTRFNPEFAFSNKIRDIQEVLVYSAAQSELGAKGTANVVAKEARLENVRAVLDGIRGKDSDGARLYKQMRDDGGTTGGLGLSTRKQTELDIAEIRKLNRSNPRMAAQKTLELVDKWNTIFEDSSRLSVYRAAIENGASRQRAAVLAKESSVNFNKFGKQGQIINALYIFANASIQGTTKTIRAMKNPKVAATVTTAVFGSVYAVSEWNDQIDPDWRNKMTTWDRLNSLAIMLPSEEGEGVKYVTIPVAWGIKPIKVIADEMVDLASGNSEGLASATASVLTATLEAYNPAGGSDVISAITPTILDIPFEVARNQAWSGASIKPDWDRNAPASIQYFASLRDSTTGRMAVGISKGLSGIGLEISPADIHYSYEQLIGGAGRAANKTVNTLTAIGGGTLPEAKEVPFVSRFYKTRPDEEVGAGASEFETISKVLEEQSREKFYLNQRAEDSLQQLKNVPKEEAAAMFEQIRANDPDLAKEIAKVKKDDDKGLTFIDRKILQLGVGNGERAKFLVEKFNSLDTKEEKANLWNEYKAKGIISDNIAKQLMQLLKD